MPCPFFDIKVTGKGSHTARPSDGRDVLLNDNDQSDVYLDAAADIVRPENTFNMDASVTGSEDFADMLKIVPDAYCALAHAGAVPLHNPSFVLAP